MITDTVNSSLHSLLARIQNIELSGNSQKAMQEYVNLGKIFPDSAIVEKFKGRCLIRLGRFQDALICLENAYKTIASDGELAHLLAVCNEHLELFDKAEEHYQRAVKNFPLSPAVCADYADFLIKKRQNSTAQTLLSESLHVFPENALLWNVQGKLFLAQYNLKSAIQCFKQAIRLNSHFIQARINLAAALYQSKEYTQALNTLLPVTQIAPDNYQLLHNLSVIHLELNHLEQARKTLSRLASLYPVQAETLNNLGLLHQRSGQYNEAIAYHDKSLSLRPDMLEARWLRSHALLMTGNFTRGWQDYETGLDIPGERETRFKTHRDWSVHELKDKTVLLIREQGIGDQVMFLSCLSDLIASGARIKLDVDARLSAVVSRSFPEVELVHPDKLDTVAESADFAIALGSLPSRFRAEQSCFPDRSRYFETESVKNEIWRERLNNLGPDLKIGISLRGGNSTERARKSFAFSQWQNLLSQPGIQFVNVQYDSSLEETEALNLRYGINLKFLPQMNAREDVDGFSSLLDSLDLLISVSNTTVHLAGAVGLPTLLLLPRSQSWRWGETGQQSLWYQKVQIFRLGPDQNPDSLFAQVIAEMRDKVLNILN